jgi:hypothetical protein
MHIRSLIPLKIPYVCDFLCQLNSNLRVELYESGVAIRTGTSNVGLAGPDNQDGKCKRHPPRAPVGVSLWYQGWHPSASAPNTVEFDIRYK